MPHLSPMMWIFSLILFWTALIILSVSQWWNQAASYPFKSSKSSLLQNNWKWL